MAPRQVSVQRNFLVVRAVTALSAWDRVVVVVVQPVRLVLDRRERMSLHLSQRVALAAGRAAVRVVLGPLQQPAHRHLPGRAAAAVEHGRVTTTTSRSRHTAVMVLLAVAAVAAVQIQPVRTAAFSVAVEVVKD